MKQLPNLWFQLRSHRRSQAETTRTQAWTATAMEQSMDALTAAVATAEAFVVCIAACCRAGQGLGPQLVACGGLMAEEDSVEAEGQQLQRLHWLAKHHLRTLWELRQDCQIHPRLLKCWVVNFRWRTTARATLSILQEMASQGFRLWKLAKRLCFPSADMHVLVSVAAGSGCYL